MVEYLFRRKQKSRFLSETDLVVLCVVVGVAVVLGVCPASALATLASAAVLSVIVEVVDEGLV